MCYIILHVSLMLGEPWNGNFTENRTAGQPDDSIRADRLVNPQINTKFEK